MSQSLIPEGKGATDLTVMELATISRKLKADVMWVISSEGHPERVTALAYMALAWKKRTDPDAKLADFEAMTFRELLDLLKIEKPTADSEEPDSLEEALEANPTDSGHESPSLVPGDSIQMRSVG